MAITTLDGVFAGLQPPQPFAKAVSATPVAGRPQILDVLGGFPGAFTQSTSLNGANVVNSSLSAGVNAIPRVDPGSGNAYLANFVAACTVPGTMLLIDKLWSNGGFTITATTNQTFTQPTLPARDINGATAGAGVFYGLEVSAAAGAASPTLTLGYTNSAGTTGRTATNLDATSTSPTAGAFYRFGLQAGDVGIQLATGLTLSASWVSGTINLVAYRVLATLCLPVAGVPNAIDALTGGGTRIYNGTAPYLLYIPSTATAFSLSGQYIETQG